MSATMSEEHDKHYLGDGAYVHHDGFAVWITTSNGLRTTNAICLEPEVLEALLEYVERFKARRLNAFLARAET